jgi:peptide-methionine (S)-S-oxide reductase
MALRYREHGHVLATLCAMHPLFWTVFSAVCLTMTACAQSSNPVSQPESTLSHSPQTEVLVLGGGCFWCVEAAYELVPGVLAAESGYAGGARSHPSYEQVCSGATGHAEVVKISFDPRQVTRAELLDFFWDIHDPTTLNRQGGDIGTQYRSVVYYASESEKDIVLAARDQANRSWGDKIVTEISPLPEFFLAEDYHQNYYQKNPTAGYCRAVIKPKLDKLKHAPLVQPKASVAPN